MKIKAQHRNKVWKSLVEWRSGGYCGSLSAGSQSASTGAGGGVVTASNVIQMQQQGQQTALPAYYEVTKYTFKHTISKKNDQDHDYC
jgi:hypothetical protein